MPKKYEDEIREILKGMDDVPGDGARGSRRTGRGPGAPGGRRPTFRGPAMPSLSLHPQRIMGLALILILFAWIMQGPWSRGFPDVFRFAGYVSLAGTVLFVVALIAMFRARGFGAMGGFGSREQRWRGQPIYLPSRQPFWTRWRHALTRLFRPARRRRGPGPPGRDSYQW